MKKKIPGFIINLNKTSSFDSIRNYGMYSKEQSFTDNLKKKIGGIYINTYIHKHYINKQCSQNFS